MFLLMKTEWFDLWLYVFDRLSYYLNYNFEVYSNEKIYAVNFVVSIWCQRRTA